MTRDIALRALELAACQTDHWKRAASQEGNIDGGRAREDGTQRERERVGGGTFEGQSGGHPIGTVSISFFRHPPPPHLASAH